MTDQPQVHGRGTPAEVTPETIALGKVTISPLNPRHGYAGDVTTLVADIEVNKGVLQPMILRRTQDGFEVIAGARRFKALEGMRGSEGVLNAGEYRLVDWNDDRCIRAAISENREREDLSPLVEGKFLNRLAKRLAEEGVKVTDDLLEEKTGINDSRISDERAMADKAYLLPKSWQDALDTPANRRLGDKPAVTVTHYKHVRKHVNGEIPKNVLGLMTTAANELWSAARLKQEVDALDERSREQPPNPRADGSGAPKDPTVEGEPDYKSVLRALRSALARTSKDEELAGLLESAIRMVEERLEAQKAETRAADAGTGDSGKQQKAA